MKSFGVLGLLAVLAIAASLRVWDCPLCGRPPAPVCCPGCGDAGRVSALTRVRRQRSERRVLALFEHPGRFTSALASLVSRPLDVDILYSGHARFALCDGEDVVVAVLTQARRSTRASQRAEAWMFSPRGEPMHHFVATHATAAGGVGLSFVDGGSALLLLTGSGVTLWPDEERPTVLTFEEKEAFRFCRVRMSGGKFERVLP